MTLVRTPSQTVGPFYSIGLCRRPLTELDPAGVELHGVLYDGAGEPVRDGLIELWDAAGGRFGRSGTEREGRFGFRVPAVRHLEALVFARGLLRHQLTRIYLDGKAAEADLAALPPADRATLLAVDEGGAFRFDIRLQGPRATVFFAH
jgi:protocatechuate 3,4-dioxygenase alpha subunit